MKKNVVFACALLGLAVSSVLPAAAQSAQAPAGPTSTPALVEITARNCGRGKAPRMRQTKRPGPQRWRRDRLPSSGSR